MDAVIDVIVCWLQDIGTAWKSLENAEKGFEEWLLSEMQRCVRADVCHLFL